MRLSARCHVPPAARRGPDPSRPGDGARSWPGTAPVSGSDLLTPHQTSSSSTSSSSGSGAGDAVQPRRLQRDLIKPRWKKAGKKGAARRTPSRCGSDLQTQVLVCRIWMGGGAGGGLQLSGPRGAARSIRRRPRARPHPGAADSWTWPPAPGLRFRSL